jgi:N-acetylhexosamine 1-kinase
MDIVSTIAKVIGTFFEGAAVISAHRLSIGHIHVTYHVMISHEAQQHEVLLQQFASQVFKYPYRVAKNIALVTEHLQTHQFAFTLSVPIYTPDAQPYVAISTDDGHQTLWRAFTYLKDTRSYAVAPTYQHVEEALYAFGMFQKVLSSMDTTLIEAPIKGFMDNPKRLTALQAAVDADSKHRKDTVGDLLQRIKHHQQLFQLLEDLKRDPMYRQKITHGDMKLNNILFQGAGHHVCAVIDLDTCMVGDYLFDYGDFMRVACATAAEDEKEEQRIGVSVDALRAAFTGLARAGISLCTAEKEALVYAGAALALTVGARFLTDYLQGDSYFHIAYPEHNLVRARNQILLAERFMEQENVIAKTIKEIL